jgi:hypothetical protein
MPRRKRWRAADSEDDSSDRYRRQSTTPSESPANRPPAETSGYVMRGIDFCNATQNMKKLTLWRCSARSPLSITILSRPRLSLAELLNAIRRSTPLQHYSTPPCASKPIQQLQATDFCSPSGGILTSTIISALNLGHQDAAHGLPTGIV